MNRAKFILRFCICLCLCLYLSAAHAGLADAAQRAEYKVKYFNYAALPKTSDQGEGIRFEIGLDKPLQDFTFQVAGDNARQLVLDLKKTRLTKVKKHVGFDGKIAEKLEFVKIDRANSQVVLTAAMPLNNQNYKVYTLPAEPKLKKPFRIVMEVFAEKEFAFTAGLAGKRILLDAGHGGSDTGAIGPSGLREKDVTLDVALKAKAILRKAGAEVIMTRNVDRDVYGPSASAAQELKARVDAGARRRADIFVSIHANSFTSPEAHGTATYYYRKSMYDDLLAASLQEGLVEYGGLYDRGCVQANFYVVKRSAVPAALVELAFISNYTEESLLAEPGYRKRLAEGICKGLSNFFVKAQR